MFAISFDLTVAEVEALHPKGVSQAYADVGGVLKRSDFTPFIKERSGNQ